MDHLVEAVGCPWDLQTGKWTHTHRDLGHSWGRTHWGVDTPRGHMLGCGHLVSQAGEWTIWGHIDWGVENTHVGRAGCNLEDVDSVVSRTGLLAPWLTATNLEGKERAGWHSDFLCRLGEKEQESRWVGPLRLAGRAPGQCQGPGRVWMARPME